jgi:hypothetical protein
MFYFKDCFQGWIGEGITSDMLAQVKPTRAGSSIGVVVAYGVNDAAQKAEEIISEVQKLSTILLESFRLNSVIILRPEILC